jgi:hypothetical protein
MLRTLAVIRSGAASIGPPDDPREKRPTGRARRGRTPRWHRSCVASGAAQAVRAAVAPMPRLRSRQSLVGSCALGRGPPAFCQSVARGPGVDQGTFARRSPVCTRDPMQRGTTLLNLMVRALGSTGLNGSYRWSGPRGRDHGPRCGTDVRDRGASPCPSCGSRAWRLVGRGPAGSECPSLGTQPRLRDGFTVGDVPEIDLAGHPATPTRTRTPRIGNDTTLTVSSTM